MVNRIKGGGQIEQPVMEACSWIKINESHF